MNIIDHGVWLPYKPSEPPEGFPANAMYAKRDGDQVDWYDYVKEGFGADTVKIAATEHSPTSGYVIGPAVYDASMIFPPNHVVAEITDYRGDDPQKDFGQRIYNPDSRSIGPKYEPEVPEARPTPTESKILSALDSITARLEKLEGR